MKLLIIGGTRFVGRHLVTAALERGSQITLFNRGRHSASSMDVETIHGDRNADLSKLQGRRWDAVIDTCGYLPRTVKASAEALSHSVDRYVFLSSISAYADARGFDVVESAPTAKLTSEQLDQANAIDSSGQVSAVTYGRMYGGLKALCEETVEEVVPNRALIIRPGLLVGPHDYTDRFTYWVVRTARGGEVLAPGRPDGSFQFIDARDLAEWTVKMLESGGTGVYNVNGLPNNVTMAGVLQECKLASGSDATFTWANGEFLLREKVAPWSELPLWLPQDEAHPKGAGFINCDKAFAAGLRFRALKETIKDTLRWYEAERPGQDLKAGIDSDREQTLLRKWHETIEYA